MENCNYAVAAISDALKLVYVVEETAAESLGSSLFEKIDMVRKNDESCSTVEGLNNDLIALCEQLFAHLPAPTELRDAQDASFRFETR